MTGMDEKALRAALEEANSPATVTRTTRATVEAAIRAYLSALDVPTHPEGVKARVLSELSDRRLLNDVDPSLFDEIAEAVVRAVRA